MLSVAPPRIAEAPLSRHGYYEARPGDVIVRDDLLFVDVRSEDELSDDWGHIHGVRSVPMGRLMEAGLPTVKKDTPVVLVCQNGRQSRTCAIHLKDLGFKEVYHLVGGMVRWNAEERPIARRPTWK